MTKILTKNSIIKLILLSGTDPDTDQVEYFQIYLPKTQDTQTKREKGTSVPKPSVFIAGLRGCKSETTEAYKVDLTLDVNTHNDICD